MSLLITGAMGHVGYEIAKQAAARGLAVVAQYHHTFRADDAKALGPRVAWVRCDLADPFEVATLAGTPGLEGCIHSAAVPNDKTGVPMPQRTFDSNVAATQYLLESARLRGWRRFILVSTGAVYQQWKDKDKPIPETEPPTPLTLYGSTKRCAEILTEVYAHTYQVSAAVVRISWVFGPPLVPAVFDGPRGPIPEFLRRALRGEPIDEPGGGDFAASFTYVDDCAAGLLEAYLAPTLKYRSYNLGSGENYRTARVAEAVRAAVPGSVVAVGPGVEPWTRFTVLRGPLSCERMKEDLGFAPRFTLESAIRHFADWMRAHPQSHA